MSFSLTIAGHTLHRSGGDLLFGLFIFLLVWGVLSLVRRSKTRNVIAELNSAGYYVNDHTYVNLSNKTVVCKAGRYKVTYNLHRAGDKWRLYYTNPDTGERKLVSKDKQKDDMQALREMFNKLQSI